MQVNGHTYAPAGDVFDQIARRLLAQTALITAPGATDPRWGAIIAQAYREGLAALASRHAGGVLFRMDADGLMDVIALE